MLLFYLLLFYFLQFKEFVARANLAWHTERHMLSLVGCVYRIKLIAYLVDIHLHHTRGRTGDKELVAYRELGSLACKLSHTKL